jgi:transposase
MIMEPGFFVPTRNGELLRWLFANGFRARCGRQLSRPAGRIRRPRDGSFPQSPTRVRRVRSDCPNRRHFFTAAGAASIKNCELPSFAASGGRSALRDTEDHPACAGLRRRARAGAASGLMQRHRQQEFIRFLDTVEAQVTARKAIHAIVDNYATHKHPKVQKWLARHPRWTFHFTPPSASWLNAVEGFFAKLTRRRLKRACSGRSTISRLQIECFVAETNDDPKPFVWTAKPNRVLAAVKRGKQALESIH